MMRKQFITRCSVFLLLSSAVLLWLCAACTQADIVVRGTGDDPAEEGVPLFVKNLDMSVEVETRSIVTGGPVASEKNPNPLGRVGLFITKLKDGSVYDAAIPKQVFVYNEKETVWEVTKEFLPIPLTEEKAKVYAFYPATQTVSLSGNPLTPTMAGVTVLGEQTFDFDTEAPADVSKDVQWKIDQEDYFYGEAKEDPDRWNPEVSLTVCHALAKVSFRILEADAGAIFAGRKVKKIILKNDAAGFKVAKNADLNLKTGELVGTTEKADSLIFTAGKMMRPIGTNIAEDQSQTVPIQAFGLVVPMTNASVTLKLILDDGRVFTIKPGVSTEKTTWEKGHNYIYTLRMTPQGVMVANVEVVDWTDGAAFDVPVEE